MQHIQKLILTLKEYKNNFIVYHVLHAHCMPFSHPELTLIIIKKDDNEIKIQKSIK